MSRRVAVLLNRAAGSARGREAAASIADALRRAGATPAVHEVPGGRLRPTARTLAASGEADVVAAAGGDGTVSAVAAALAGGDVPFGVLPMGTLNHFARDVGVPSDLDAAAAVVATGEARPIDVGSVNGLPFLNNVTVGIYADGVRVRERWRRWVGKWPAGGIAWLVMLKRYPAMRIALEIDGATVESTSPLVVVSNNPYALAPGAPVRRDRLDAARLGVYVVAADGRLRFLWRTLKSFVAPLEGAKGLEARIAPEAVLHLRRARIKAAVDGEVVPLETPLRFRSMPGALRVIGASAGPAGPAA